MARMGRLLGALALGGVLLLSPSAGDTALAATAPPAPAAATATVAQDEPTAPPGPDLDGGRSAAEDKQRLVIGIAGIALIAAVLLSRKARKRPVFSFKWKR
ncbi:hypothetical protein ACL03H_17855 [Saccharopolyspora sp. MS10]|uniref:hypothetical protein n=1 Tax=Saccharopolyspora sp. MS10 TaxID=3385973 RepID=UPI00399EEBB5